jgi:serine protease Do
MASGLVIHIVAGADKHTEVLTLDRIRIGTNETCDLRLSASTLPPSTDPSGLILELARTNGNYRVKNADYTLEITHNGEPIEENAKIGDGDEVRIGPSGLLLTFFPVGGLPALIPGKRPDTHVAPFIENAALESAATARRDDAKVFLREFTRELVREIRLSTKLIMLAIIMALVGGVLYLGYATYKEIQRSRRLIDDQKEQLAQSIKRAEETSAQLGEINKINKGIIDTLSVAPTVWAKYKNGVCLISGTYIFVEQGTGRPLRYPEAQTNEEGVIVQNDNEPLQLTPEGKGAIYERDFVGTGFYVGGEYVLTNRHVTQPWLADEGALTLSSSVSTRPRLKKLLAFFPDHTQPVTIKVKMTAEKEDLAVCIFDLKDYPEGVPALPLDKDNDSETVRVGKTVVLMGYPNGPERILALLEEPERRSVQARYGSSLETLVTYLSTSKRIQPLTTQGSITDQDQRLIIYEATTATGGSGSPLFGQSSRVIGVNFEVFTENTASNHAVPIRYAITLLQRAGWKPPAVSDTTQDENTNSAQANLRTSSTAANTSR